MKRRKRRKPSSPAAKATRTLRKKLARAKVAYDVTTASAETIGHRTAMIGRAMTSRAELSNPEFATMSREKLLAAGQAAAAMMQQMGGAQRIWTDFWFRQMQRTCAVLPALAGSRTPARLIQVATGSAGAWMADCTAFWTKTVELAEAVADAGAKPIHRTVVRNAKRLARAP
jgi:hypothetical protein